MNESQHVDPAHFLRSFFVIAGHYVILFFGLLMGILLITRIRFPSGFHLCTLPEADQDEFYEAWEKTPELLFPAEFCVWMVVLAVLLSIFIGLQVAFWAPFAKSGHGIFLAIICICTYLQISMTQPQIPKSMMVGMLLLSPLMIVVFSRLGERWFSHPPAPGEDSPEAS